MKSISKRVIQVTVCALAIALFVAELAISGIAAQSEGRIDYIGNSKPHDAIFSNVDIDDSSTSTSYVTPKYSPVVLDWDNVPVQTQNIAGFSLKDDSSDKPVISQTHVEDIQKCIERFEENDADLGFCMVNLETGKGLAYNIDTMIYGASSMKAHVVVFSCQEQVAKGKLPFEYLSEYAYNAIVESDDDAYMQIKDITGRQTQDMYDWLDSMNLDHYLSDDTDYPHYTVRDSMKLWTNAYLFLSEGSEEAQQIQEMMGSTTTSFLRDGIVQNPDEDDVKVLNKGGWIADPFDSLYALVDAGIVYEDGHPYLISIMTGAYDSEDNRALVSEMCSQLWNARSFLS